MKKLFVSALICGAMVLVSSGNGRSSKPLNQGDAQPSGEHQVEGRSVPKPLVSQSFDLPVGYVVGVTMFFNLKVNVKCIKLSSV